MNKRLRLILAMLLLAGMVLIMVLLMGNPLAHAEDINLQAQTVDRWQFGDVITPLPRYGGEFDCDDAALYSYIWLTGKGYKVDIMYGNLETRGENFWTSNHYWVIVEGHPYDLGFYMPDEQHFEGLKVTYKDLLRAAIMD